MKKPSVLPRPISQEPAKKGPKAKLRFVPTQEDLDLLNPSWSSINYDQNDSKRRNHNYRVLLDETCIGGLKAQFLGDRKYRTWMFPPHIGMSFSKIHFANGMNLDLPLRQMKCLLREILLNQPDLSAKSLMQVAEFARKLYRQQTPKSRRAATQRVKIIPSPENESIMPDRQFVYRIKKSNEYTVYLDGEIMGYLTLCFWAESEYPTWKFTDQLLEYLELTSTIRFPIQLSMPLNHCKALLRHTLKNSLSLKGTQHEELLEMAKFSRQQELAAIRLEER